MADKKPNWNTACVSSDEEDDEDGEIVVDLHSPVNSGRSHASRFRPTTAGPRGRTPHTTARVPQQPVSDADIPSTSRSPTYGSRHLNPQSDTAGSSTAQPPTFVSQVEQEEAEVRQVGAQARGLLGLFLQDQFSRSALSENPNAQPIIREVCQAEHTLQQTGFTDENLSDIAITLRRIGDDISRDVELNNAIDKVPVRSTREIFMKVCHRMFEDGNFNWGRVVALFYFAYRLIAKAIQDTFDSTFDGMPWVHGVVGWVVDFIVKYVAKWIISRGGWTMIQEWLGIGTKTYIALSFCAFAAVVWTLFKKD